MEEKEILKQELKEVCNEIANIPFKMRPTRDERREAEKLWHKKRSILAQLNPINEDKLYV